jgi:hypothetical protein
MAIVITSGLPSPCFVRYVQFASGCSLLIPKSEARAAAEPPSHGVTAEALYHNIQPDVDDFPCQVIHVLDLW